MSLKEIDRHPPFRQSIRANGHAEVWTHTSEDFKLQQFGWRCSNKESSYNIKTLNGNWYEERCDSSQALRNKPLPSDFDHYYQTTCNNDYSKTAPQVSFDDPYIRQKMRKIAGRLARSFPGHHPEYDSDVTRELNNSFITTSRNSFVDPRLRKEPMSDKPRVDSTHLEDNN